MPSSMAMDADIADATVDATSLNGPTKVGSPLQKRKWEEQASTPGPLMRQLQVDVLDVLRTMDTQPSFLSFDLSKSHASASSPKKARVAEESKPKSIGEQLRDSAYNSLHELKDDIAAVSEAMKETARTAEKESDPSRVSVKALKHIQHIDSFVKAANDIVDSEYHRHTNRTETDTLDAKPGQASSADRARSRKGANNAGMDSVLTLFGNAPTPRQLFSSMQLSSSSHRSGRGTSRLSVEEMGLPVGLSTTIIHPSANDHSRIPPGFAESFPPPHNLPTLLPPKTQRRSSTRDSSITWEFRDGNSRANRKGGYTVQDQSAGSWLGYGGMSPVKTLTSPREKRKQRDRALSSGERKREAVDAAALASAARLEEQALFQRAYSGFAPSRDDSKALLNCDTKNVIWWEKTGKDRYEDRFGYDPALIESYEGSTDSAPTQSHAVELDIDALASWWDDSNGVEFEGANSIDPGQGEIAETLRTISQLLETLASYQHIRNASLPTSTLSTRSPLSPAPLLAAKVGQPDAPAEEEIELAKKVRHELAYLLLKLPPYAVAKLDGEKFEALGITKLIPFVSQNTRGTLEEDQVARLTKHSAIMAANRSVAGGGANLHRNGSSSSQHYNSTAQRTPAIGQAANTRYGQQYGTGRTPTATPQNQRTPSHGHHGGVTMSVRPGYGSSFQQGRQGAGHHGQQYAGQRPPSFSTYGSSFQHTPQPNTRPNYALSQQFGHYQQRHSVSGNAPSTNAPHPQQSTVSPTKPVSDYTQARTPGSARINPPPHLQGQGGGVLAAGKGASNHSSQAPTPINGSHHRSSQGPL